MTTSDWRVTPGEFPPGSAGDPEGNAPPQVAAENDLYHEPADDYVEPVAADSDGQERIAQPPVQYEARHAGDPEPPQKAERGKPGRATVVGIGTAVTAVVVSLGVYLGINNDNEGERPGALPDTPDLAEPAVNPAVEDPAPEQVAPPPAAELPEGPVREMASMSLSAFAEAPSNSKRLYQAWLVDSYGLEPWSQTESFEQIFERLKYEFTVAVPTIAQHSSDDALRYASAVFTGRAANSDNDWYRAFQEWHATGGNGQPPLSNSSFELDLPSTYFETPDQLVMQVRVDGVPMQSKFELIRHLRTHNGVPANDAWSIYSLHGA